MKHQQPSLTIVGDIGIDLVLGPIDHWPEIGTETIVARNELRAGGSAGNCALAARYLGSTCQLISVTGNDDFGTWLRAQFDGFGVPLPALSAPTSQSVGIIHTCGERTFFTTKGHLQDLDFDHVMPQLPQTCAPGSVALLSGVFLTPKLRARYGDLITALRERGFKVALDTGWPPEGWSDTLRQEIMTWVSACDHLLLNETEVLHLTEKPDLIAALDSLASIIRPGGCVVAKTGAKGACANEAGRIISATTPKTQPFDTIGAGDSFNAGYLLARLEGQDTAASLRAGCFAASAIISRFPRKDIKAGELVTTGQAGPLRATA